MSEPQFLDEALKVLGWQGGTIHQVLDEIKRLKEAEPRWLSIETAPYNKPVLLKYHKGNKGCRTRVSGVEVVTEATYTPPGPPLWWKPEYTGEVPVYYDHWVDHLGRLLVDMKSKDSKNKPIAWMPMP